jgi:hypothetical protein
LGVVDRRARSPDGGEQRGKDLVAVQQQVDAVAGHDRRTEMRLESPDERGIADGQGGKALDAWRGRAGGHDQKAHRDEHGDDEQPRLMRTRRRRRRRLPAGA